MPGAAQHRDHSGEPAVVPAEAVDRMLQQLPSFQEFMDAMGTAKDSERNDVFQAELRKQMLAGLSQG